MSRTPDEIANDVIEKLKVTAPGFSAALGTPERKIIDAFSESLSEAYIDQYLVGSLMDVDTKVGVELEQWMGIFGFGRLQGRRATGVVRVELNSAAVQDTTIQTGSQFYTRNSLPGTANQVYFTATTTVTIPIGSYVADVPVECTVPGVVGNVPPDSIVFHGAIMGAATVTNLTAMTGGVDVETDDELRARFKATFLRNVAGTDDFYLGLAYQNKNVSRAVVFGPITKYVTQVEVPGESLTLPVHADVKYAWPLSGSVFKNLGQEDEVFYRDTDDYTLSSGTSPVLTRVPSGTMEVGDVVDVEFEYTTRSSRNDPLNGITNKVDLFVNGVDPYTVTERTVITSQTLSSDSASELYVGKFQRFGTAGTPSAANRFMRLGSVPLVSFPSSVTVGVVRFVQGVHYHVLRGTTLLAGSVREVAGIEWLPAGPSNDTQLTLTYVYNRVPEVLGAIVKKAKQITTDIVVHEAAYQYLRLYLSVEYDRGYIPSQVNNAIQDRLRLYFAGMGFGQWVEISDLTLAAHQVLGVDNVKLTTDSEDPANYGIKSYNDSNDPSPQTTYTDDFKLADSQLPIFLEAVVLRKANR